MYIYIYRRKHQANMAFLSALLKKKISFKMKKKDVQMSKLHQKGIMFLFGETLHTYHHTLDSVGTFWKTYFGVGSLKIDFKNQKYKSNKQNCCEYYHSLFIRVIHCTVMTDVMQIIVASIHKTSNRESRGWALLWRLYIWWSRCDTA